MNPIDRQTNEPFEPDKRPGPNYKMKTQHSVECTSATSAPGACTHQSLAQTYTKLLLLFINLNRAGDLLLLWPRIDMITNMVSDEVPARTQPIPNVCKNVAVIWHIVRR